MKEKATSRKAWFVLAMNLGILLGAAFGFSQEFTTEIFLWLNVNYIGFQGIADLAQNVTGYKPSDLPVSEKLHSRKFWVGLGTAGAALVLVHFGLSENTAKDVIEWATTAYLGTQGVTDAAGALRPLIAKPIPSMVGELEPDGRGGETLHWKRKEINPLESFAK